MKNIIDNFYLEVCQLLPSHKSFMNVSLGYLTTQDRELFNRYLHYCLSSNLTLQDVVESYVFIIQETIKEQMYFKRHKKYRFSKYSEVSDRIYNNNEYMKKYMCGLAVSSFLWLNHIKIKRFFEETIMTSCNKNDRSQLLNLSLDQQKEPSYLEVGPGHGIFFMLAINSKCAQLYDAVDISPTSVKMTNDIMNSGYFGNFSNFNIIENNFLNFNTTQPYDFLVMGEVIEHVEQPIDFLKKAYSLTTNQPFVFITTCINAPEIDHIYLFSTVDEVHELIFSSGFRITKEFILPYSGTTLEKSVQEALPINVAYVLGK